MIHLLAIMDIRNMAKSDPLRLPRGEAEWDDAISKHADGTFMRHLHALRDKGLLSPPAWEICEEVNRARDHFLHWKPGRFTTPKYYGQDVTTSEGLNRCLNDVFDILGAIVGGEDDEVPWRLTLG